MTKRRWLILLFSFLLLLPILLISSVIVWVSTESETVIPEPLPDYPNSQPVQGFQNKKFVQSPSFCNYGYLTRDGNRVFVTKDSLEQVAAYYDEWVIRQGLKINAFESPFTKGQSNNCFMKQNGLFAARTAVGFVYLSYSETQSAKMIKDLLPNLDGATNVIISLRGIIIQE